jgi:hypothetical protein
VTFEELIAHSPAGAREIARPARHGARAAPGRGRVHRHVRVTDPEASRSPALRDLMRRAAQRAR